MILHQIIKIINILYSDYKLISIFQTIKCPKNQEVPIKNKPFQVKLSKNKN